MGRFPSSTIFNRRPSPTRFFVHELQRLRRVAYPRAWFTIPEAIPAPIQGSSISTPSGLEKESRSQMCPVARLSLPSVVGAAAANVMPGPGRFPSANLRGRARPQQGGSANKTHNAHHREPRPGEGTPVDRHLQARLFPPLLADCRWGCSRAYTVRSAIASLRVKRNSVPSRHMR